MGSENQKRRPAWKLNLFDAVIILLAVAAAVGFLWWKGVFAKPSVEEDGSAVSRTVRYTIELPTMYGDSAEMICAGDKIVDSQRKYDMGQVTAVEISDATMEYIDGATGICTMVPMQGYQRAVVTVDVSCSETDRGIITDGEYVIRAGKSVQLRGPGYAAAGVILSIEREAAE